MVEKQGVTFPEAPRPLYALVEQSHDGIILLKSASGRFCDMNPTACRLLGYERDALLGTSAADLHGPLARPWAAVLNSALRASPPPRSKTVVIAGQAGAPTIYNLAINQANFEGTSYLLVVARDITDCDLAPLNTRLERALSSPSDLRQVIETIADYATQISSADVSCVLTFDPDNPDLGLMTSDAGPALCDDIAPCAKAALRHTAFKQTLLEHRIVHLSDLPGAPESSLSHLKTTLADRGLRAAIFIPLLRGAQLLGLILIGQHTQRDLTGEERLRLHMLAQHSVGAIEHARLFAAQCAQREVTKALEAAASIVTSTLDLDQVLDRILEQTARVVNGDAFNIMLIEEDNVRIVRWRGYEAITSDLQPNVLHNACENYPNLLRMLQTGQPVITPDTMNNSDWVTTLDREWRRSYVAAPIQISDQTVGFLNVNGMQPYQFDEQDAQRLKAFADHAAIAIQNARHYERQRHYADELEQRVEQRTMLLQAQKAWLEAILSSTTDAIFVTDGDGHIVKSNRVAGTWLSQTLPADDVASLQAQIRQLAHQADERPNVVLELSSIDLQLSAAPISEQDTTGPAVVIIGHDVTHLKTLERMKSRFVSNASHELRTPIASIQLYVSLLRNAPPQRREQYFEALDQEVAQISRLVEDILEISRIDAARLDFDPQPVNFDYLIATAVASYQLLAESEGVALSYHTPSPGTRALIDTDQFSHVVGNLIINAINYTPASGRIDVSTDVTTDVSTAQQISGERAWAALIVADTGMGIPDSEMGLIFERFHRGEASRKRHIPGSGLGLAIVKEIVELHGGRVTVESQVNVGSTFTVHVPLA